MRARGNCRCMASSRRSGIERRDRALHADLAVRDLRQLPARGEPAQFRKREDALHAGRRSEGNGVSGGRSANHSGSRGARSPREDLVGIGAHGKAGGHRDSGQWDHRVRLLTCWYIWSAAFTTLEFAS